jgi:hypothetical protein
VVGGARVVGALGELVNCVISVGWWLLAVRGAVTVTPAGVAVISGVVLVMSGVEERFPGTGRRTRLTTDQFWFRMIC